MLKQIVYRIPILPPGVYEVKIEINGFNTQIKKYEPRVIQLAVKLNF